MTTETSPPPGHRRRGSTGLGLGVRTIVTVYYGFARYDHPNQETLMAVYSVWESYFPAEAAAEGRAATETIWRDMTQFDGYLTHELIEDLDDSGHLLVVSQWTTRQRADDVLREYATDPSARRANALVSRPRTRLIGRAIPGGA
jgi:quinol monooxygenase YgiN